MIIIGLGANLKSKNGALPIQSLQRAAKELRDQGIKPVAGSSIWKSAPVPVSDQPWYHNAVCQVETQLSASELLQVVISIEEVAGREHFVRNEARVLDLDILAYNNEIIEFPRLQIPHPRMHQRAFVLYPLQEIAPSWVHPVLGNTLEEAISLLDTSQEIKRTDTSLL